MTTRPRQYLWLVAGFIVWGFALNAVYGTQALGCAFGLANPWINVAVGVVVAVHLAVVGWMILHWRHRVGEGFLGRVTWWALWAAAVAIFGNFAPLVLLTTCLP